MDTMEKCKKLEKENFLLREKVALYQQQSIENNEELQKRVKANNANTMLLQKEIENLYAQIENERKLVSEIKFEASQRVKSDLQEKMMDELESLKEENRELREDLKQLLQERRYRLNRELEKKNRNLDLDDESDAYERLNYFPTISATNFSNLAQAPTPRLEVNMQNPKSDQNDNQSDRQSTDNQNDSDFDTFLECPIFLGPSANPVETETRPKPSKTITETKKDTQNEKNSKQSAFLERPIFLEASANPVESETRPKLKPRKTITETKKDTQNEKNSKQSVQKTEVMEVQLSQVKAKPMRGKSSTKAEQNQVLDSIENINLNQVEKRVTRSQNATMSYTNIFVRRKKSSNKLAPTTSTATATKENISESKQVKPTQDGEESGKVVTEKPKSRGLNARAKANNEQVAKDNIQVQKGKPAKIQLTQDDKETDETERAEKPKTNGRNVNPKSVKNQVAKESSQEESDSDDGHSDETNDAVNKGSKKIVVGSRKKRVSVAPNLCTTHQAGLYEEKEAVEVVQKKRGRKPRSETAA